MAEIKKDKILLPNGNYMERLCTQALIMEKGYQKRYEELVMYKPKEAVVLMHIITEMNENNEFITDFGTIAVSLNLSRASVARAVKVLREQYSDLITIGKFHNVSKFTIDKSKCFKSTLTN